MGRAPTRKDTAKDMKKIFESMLILICLDPLYAFENRPFIRTETPAFPDFQRDVPRRRDQFVPNAEFPKR
jgi:hypothetical protein